MISKFVEAKKKKTKKIYLLGTGKPIREFIHTKDLAEAIITCLNISRKKLRKNFKNKLPIFNIGTGESLNISKLANLIAKLVNFEGKIIFDNRFPDGTFKKNLNSNKINRFGWKSQIKLKDGLKELIQSRLI
jgi:nucleoside-diphosphate-sugar epimerase